MAIGTAQSPQSHTDYPFARLSPQQHFMGERGLAVEFCLLWRLWCLSCCGVTHYICDWCILWTTGKPNHHPHKAVHMNPVQPMLLRTLACMNPLLGRTGFTCTDLCGWWFGLPVVHRSTPLLRNTRAIMFKQESPSAPPPRKHKTEECQTFS